MSFYPDSVTNDGKMASATPVIQAAAYAAGDAVGGKMAFEVARAMGALVRITDIVVLDKGDQSAALNLVLFDRDFTATADNDPFDPSDADMANIVAVLKVAGSDYVSFVDNAVATKELNTMCRPVGNTLYGQLVSGGTPTYASTSDLTIKLAVVQL